MKHNPAFEVPHSSIFIACSHLRREKTLEGVQLDIHVSVYEFKAVQASSQTLGIGGGSIQFQ